MLAPTLRWIPPEPVAVPADALEAGAGLGLSPRVIGLLAARGCATGTDMAAFLGPASDALHDPSLLPDAGVLRARIARAREAGERVLVLGDFDADGLSGLAVLVRVLRAAGLAVESYVPDRIAEGHGLSAAAVETAADRGCRLILTVDCGTSSAAEVALARERGIDVAITDHHHLPDDPAEPLALVNPARPDSAYPERRLTGAGVAFKVAQLIAADAGLSPETWLDLADLAAIGTIADVAPLLGENRAIVRLGVERLRHGPRPGLAALLQACAVDQERVDAEVIAFAIAPRINAAGRMGEATRAARLLLSEDPAEAVALAEELEVANRSRRELTATVADEVRGAAAPLDGQSAHVVAGPWPVGIIGLVAGKLAEETRTPWVVVSTAVTPWRASARAGPGLDLARAFASCGHHLVRFGGHAGAAGCDLAEERFEAFRADFLALAGSIPPADPQPVLQLDLAVPPSALEYGLYRELARLAPFGTGNPVPVLAIEGIGVTRVRAATGGHTQLTFAKGREVLDGIAFDRPDLAEAVREGDVLDVAARLTSRTFGGYETLQLEVLDAATSRPAIAAPDRLPARTPAAVPAPMAAAATPSPSPAIAAPAHAAPAAPAPAAPVQVKAPPIPAPAAFPVASPAGHVLVAQQTLPWPELAFEAGATRRSRE